MFCIKCGKEIPDGSNFCPACGAVQSKVPNPAVSEAPTVRPTTGKPKKRLIIAIGAVLAVIAIALIVILPAAGRSGAKTPEEAAKLYFEATESGNASKLAKVMYPTPGSSLAKILCLDNRDGMGKLEVYDVEYASVEDVESRLPHLCMYGDVPWFGSCADSFRYFWSDIISDWEYIDIDDYPESAQREISKDIAQFRQDVNSFDMSSVQLLAAVFYEYEGRDTLVPVAQIAGRWYYWADLAVYNYFHTKY